MPINSLPVPYHQQDQGDWCGAACVQMVLRQMGQPLIFQDDLFISNSTHSKPDTILWASAPDGINFTLNTMQGSRPFVIVAVNDPDILSRKIVWTIFHYGVAPVVLILDSLHWVVVTEYEISANPTSEGDETYTICYFKIHNPYPVTPRGDSPPPPHLDGDRCGIGGTRGNIDGLFGDPNHYVAYHDWITNYLKPVTNGFWAGKYVAVCDPDPPPKFTGKKIMPHRYFDGGRIIEPEEAAKCALEELKKTGLGHDSRLKEFDGKLSTGSPHLIQRLDSENDFYFLVPLVDENQISRCLVSIDGRYGFLKEAGFATGKEGIQIKPLSRKEILTILGNSLYLENLNLSIPVYSQALIIYPMLVWRPCIESLSPYFPFHMVIIGRHRIYVSLLKKVFAEPRVDLKGL